MRRFILGRKVLGHERRLDAHLVNYADDFVICCRGRAEEARTALRTMMAKLKLTVNEAQTRLGRGPDEPFDFLGYTIGTCSAPKTGQAYIGVQPSAKTIQGLCRDRSAQTSRRWLGLDVDDMVQRLNRQRRGWANYVRRGTVAAAYRQVTAHAGQRLRHRLVRKGVVQGSLWSRDADRHLHEQLGRLRRQRPPRPTPS